MSDQDIQSMDDDPFSEPNILCPHPDLFLLVGPNKLPIGVDARSLRRVSKVFEAMFRPPWLESTKLSENRISPPELALPEDDFRAMNVICCIIHHRNDLVPSEISASDILQVAIVADKYDMLTALKYAAGAWLKMRPDAGTPEAESILFMGNLLAAAYLFRDPEQFQAIALRLMFDYFGTYREVARNPRIVEVLGPEAPGKRYNHLPTIKLVIELQLLMNYARHSDAGGAKNSHQGRTSSATPRRCEEDLRQYLSRCRVRVRETSESAVHVHFVLLYVNAPRSRHYHRFDCLGPGLNSICSRC